jgi:hypothetical protein
LSPTPPSLWWEPVVIANRAKPGGLRVFELPVPFEAKTNDVRLIQLLKLMSVAPSTNPNVPQGVIIDVGLPEVSMTFSEAGFRVQVFEARQRGYDRVPQLLRQLYVPV